MLTIASLSLLLLLQPVAGASQTMKFTLEATHGQTVEREFRSGLIFRLAANHDPVTPGWTLEVRPTGEKDSTVELIWPVTPPYRSWNPRYLDVSYGNSASQSLAIKTREFEFIRDPGDYLRTAEAVRNQLWSYGISPQQLDQSSRVIAEVPKCRGTVRIIDSRIGTDAGTPGATRDRIEWLKVEVELCKAG